VPAETFELSNTCF